MMYSYLIYTQYFDNEMFQNNFKIRGNWEKYSEEDNKKITFLYLDGKYSYDMIFGILCLYHFIKNNISILIMIFSVQSGIVSLILKILVPFICIYF